MKKITILSIVLAILVSMSGVMATNGNSVNSNELFDLAQNNIIDYPVTVEFEVGNSILLDDTNGILELTNIDSIVGIPIGSIATYDNNENNINTYSATFTFESNSGVGAQYNLYEDDTFSIGPFDLYVDEVEDKEVVLEITRTDINNPLPLEKICCKNLNLNAEPHETYDVMTKAQCLDVITIATISRSVVDDKFCRVTTEPVPINVISPSEKPICCKITPVIQYPVSKFVWMSEDECFTCKTNLLGQESCLIGASREIVDEDLCVESQIPGNEEPELNSQILQNEKRITSKNQVQARNVISIGERVVNQEGVAKGSSSEIVTSIRIVPGNQKPIVTSTSGIAVLSNDNTENGFSMSVKSRTGVEEVFLFESTEDLWNTMIDEGQVRVKTRKTFVNDENGFGVETSNGKKEIKILPSQASEKAKEVLTEIFGEIEIKEENGKVFYEFNEEKKVRVLGFIPVNSEYSAQVDVETGEILKTSKPWFDRISSK